MDQELYYGLLRTLATGEIPNTLTEEKKNEVEKNINLYTYRGTQLFRKGDRQAPMEEDSTVTPEKLSPSIEKPRSSSKCMITHLPDTKDKETPTEEHLNSTSGPE